jgi:hypothetical protein
MNDFESEIRRVVKDRLLSRISVPSYVEVSETRNISSQSKAAF